MIESPRFLGLSINWGMKLEYIEDDNIKDSEVDQDRSLPISFLSLLETYIINKNQTESSESEEPILKSALVVGIDQDEESEYRKQLEEVGCLNVRFVSLGRDAAFLLRESKYDLVISNMLLTDPAGNAIQLVRWMREHEHLANIPIFLLLQEEQRGWIKECLEYGFDGFLFSERGKESLQSRLKLRFFLESMGPLEEVKKNVLVSLGCLDGGLFDKGRESAEELCRANLDSGLGELFLSWHLLMLGEFEDSKRNSEVALQKSPELKDIVISTIDYLNAIYLKNKLLKYSGSSKEEQENELTTEITSFITSSEDLLNLIEEDREGDDFDTQIKSIKDISVDFDHEKMAKIYLRKEVKEFELNKAYLPQNLMREQMISGSNVRKKDKNGHIEIVRKGIVKEWVSTEKISLSLEVKINLLESKKGRINLFDVSRYNPLKSYLKILIEQMQLVNNRIMSMGKKHHQDQSNYFEAIGSIFTDRSLFDLLSVYELSNLPKGTYRIWQKIKKNPSNQKLLITLGKRMLQAGYVDQLLKEVYAFAVLKKDEKNPFKVGTHGVGLFINSLTKIQPAAIVLHYKFFKGKINFEKTLALQLLQNTKVYQEKLRFFDRVLEEDNYSFESFKKVYFLLKRLDLEQKARKIFKRHMDKYSYSNCSCEATAMFLIAVGAYEDSKFYLKKIFSKDKKNVNILKYLAIISFATDNKRDTVKYCKRMIKRKVYLEYSYNMLGVLEKRKGNHKKAVQYYDEGLHCVPTSSKLYHNLSIVYACMGDKEASKKAILKAKKLSSLSSKVKSTRKSHGAA